MALNWIRILIFCHLDILHDKSTVTEVNNDKNLFNYLRTLMLQHAG
jgi:hypothetical protein